MYPNQPHISWWADFCCLLTTQILGGSKRQVQTLYLLSIWPMAIYRCVSTICILTHDLKIGCKEWEVCRGTSHWALTWRAPMNCRKKISLHYVFESVKENIVRKPAPKIFKALHVYMWWMSTNLHCAIIHSLSSRVKPEPQQWEHYGLILLQVEVSCHKSTRNGYRKRNYFN